MAGVSRSGFDPPEAGFEQLRQQILAAKPTVVIVGYGMADSFAGEAGLACLRSKGMGRLLNVDRLDEGTRRVTLPGRTRQLGPARCPTRPAITATWRVIATSSERREGSGRPHLSIYSRLFDQHVLRRRHRTDRNRTCGLQTNGIHLTEDGYWGAALFDQQAARSEHRRLV